MVSVRVKFRPSTMEGKEGVIYYQIIQNRVIRQLKTDYRLYSEEWSSKKNCIVLGCHGRNKFLLSLRERVAWDLKRMDLIIWQMENRNAKYTVDDIIVSFRDKVEKQSFVCFMRKIIFHLNQIGKVRTAENYSSALKSFMQYRQGKDILLSDINSDLMQLYEAHLHSKGVVRNTSSFYMRILRAVYNRALEEGLMKVQNPFKCVYTGVDKTIKRAIPLLALKRIKDLDLSMQPSLAFARDMFLFSFYTRGMSFVDMANLKKQNLQNGFLSYRRRKTGQLMMIKWEKCMQMIIDKYPSEISSIYLLPILQLPYKNVDVHYKSVMSSINRHLKKVAQLANVPIPISMYCARHSWACVAREKNIPISVISEGMGHDSETTTQIYLTSLDNSAVDRANAVILKEM